MAEAEAADDVPAQSGGQPSREKDSTGLVLPFARVKRLMREEADVKNIATEANYVLGRAAELLLQELAVRAHAVMQQDDKRKVHMLDYKDIAEVVHDWKALDFLLEVVPKKVSTASILAQIEQQQQKEQKKEQEQ